jgi:uncharacterized membrane protein (UPF0127 family)
MRFNQPAIFQTAQGAKALQVHTARGFWGRFRGLMLAAPLVSTPAVQALLLLRCPSVHGFFMRIALDVVYLHSEQDPSQRLATPTRFRVTHIAHLKPWRISFGQRWRPDASAPSRVLHSQHALELPSVSVTALGIARGDWLEVSIHKAMHAVGNT